MENEISTEDKKVDGQSNYLKELFDGYQAKESDVVKFDWGEPRGHEIL